MESAKLKTAYNSQKCAAKKRGIEFLLTFDEWLNWWIQTGKLELRGKTKGCYQMCRVNDVGPYSLDNIYCDTVEANSKLPIEGKPRKEGANEKALATRRASGKPWFPNGVHKPSMDEARSKVFALIEWAIETKSTLTVAVRKFGCSWNAMRSYKKEWEALNGPVPLPKRATGGRNGRVKYLNRISNQQAIA